jgi:putative hydrolase of the HAD superfamily
VTWAPLRAVTFDITGTLVHSPRLSEIYWQVLDRHGHRVRLRAVRRELPHTFEDMACQVDHRWDRFTAHSGGERGYWRAFLECLCRRLGTHAPSRFAAAELFDRFRRAESWEVFEDVVPTLESLGEQGLRLGVVSNWDHRLPDLLADLGLAPFFDTITYSSMCGVEKPHPHIFQQCLAALDVPPARALHVGDRALEDAEGALGAGMRALRLDRSEGSGCMGALIEPFLRGSRGVARVASVPPARSGGKTRGHR